jgi:protocatechuate 3,4-dioxygenase beta subunit
MSRATLVLAGLLSLVLPPACRPGRPAAEAEAAARAEVYGAVLDARTGAPVEGAEVDLPGGRTVRTDAQGRFRAVDLEPGLAGEALARAADGRTGRVTLRPLRPGPLEVVLHVSR